MSMLLCRAVVIQAQYDADRAQSGEQTEQEMFEAKSAELARDIRRQRLSRLTVSVAATWASVLDRLTSIGREDQRRKDLKEKLENMPAYMLRDIGVTRDNAGRFCYHNDYGMLVELAATDPAKTEGRAEAEGPQVAAAAQ
jgi:uncharacterized protein YjiS (DUF1127 family)